MYSKLGGCLRVTAKLGPLARTDLWAGVKGLLDRLMTHLGLGSSLEEPWWDLLGGMGVGLPSQEVELSSWEGWVGLCPGGVPITLPACPGGLWPWPAWVVLEGWGELFHSLCIWREEAWDELTSSKGRCEAPGRKLLPSLGGRWAVARPGAWEVGVLFPSKEGCTVAGRELLPSPGGRWAIARLGRLPDAWKLGALFPSEEGCTVTGRELLPSPGGRWAIAGLGRCLMPGYWESCYLLRKGVQLPGGELLPSLGGRWAMAGVERLPMTWLAGLGWLLITWLLLWGGPVPSGRRWPVAEGLSPSLGVRRTMAGVGLQGLPN